LCASFGLTDRPSRAQRLYAAAGLSGSLSFVNAPLPFNRKFDVGAIVTTVAVPLLLGMAFAYVSTAFASGIVKEKENRAKHQQVGIHFEHIFLRYILFLIFSDLFLLFL
jgi:hypothetical protein